MKKIAVTGSGGLIGSRFTELLKNNFNLSPLASFDFDITDYQSMSAFLDKINPSIIVHFAARTDVDACEKDKNNDSNRLIELGILDNGGINIQNINPMDWKNNSSAFSVNVAGTKNLADYCLSKKIKMVYVSTDFVFAGNKDYYSEEDVPDPVNWYGQTKYWGEKIVSDILDDYITVRLAYPYGFKSPVKSDFVWKIYELLKNVKEVFLVKDQIITPTFIDDIVLGIKFLIDKDASGLYHLDGDSYITPFDAGKIIACTFLANDVRITGVKADDYYKDRAKRGFKLRMKNDKLEKMGFKTKTFGEGIDIIKRSL